MSHFLQNERTNKQIKTQKKTKTTEISENIKNHDMKRPLDETKVHNITDLENKNTHLTIYKLPELNTKKKLCLRVFIQ